MQKLRGVIKIFSRIHKCYIEEIVKYRVIGITDHEKN